MLNTHALLDAAKHAQGITSEYRLARVLGISDNGLYNYRHGRTPDDARAMKLAELARLDPGYVLICMAAERAKDESQRAALTSTAQLVAEMLGVKIPPSDPGSDNPPNIGGPDKMPAAATTPKTVRTSMASGRNGDARASVEVSKQYTLTKVSEPSPLAFYASGWPRQALSRLNSPRSFSHS